MTKAKKLLETLSQYSLTPADTHVPVSSTHKILGSGIYTISLDMSGSAHFKSHELVTDEILRFKDPRHELVLQEVDDFWKLGDKFKGLKFTHKRGILLEGLPGSGKSVLLKLMMESIVNSGDVVFLSSDLRSTIRGLKQFREVEPERKAVVVFEDVDELLVYDERSLLELLDGDQQVDKVLYVATTNHLERISPRARRSGRFDRVLKIPFPPTSGRLAYFKAKLGKFESKEIISDLAQVTKGFSFAMLKEVLVSTYIYGYKVSDTVERLLNSNLLETRSTSILEKSIKIPSMTLEQKQDLKDLTSRILPEV